MKSLHAWVERLPIDPGRFGMVAVVSAALSLVPPVVCLVAWEAEHWRPQAALLTLTPALALVAKVTGAAAFAKDHRWGRTLVVGLLVAASAATLFVLARLTGLRFAV